MKTQFDLEHFYKEVHPVAHHYVSGYVHNTEDARDIVGDAFLRFLELEGRWDGAKNMRALFFSVLHNKCMDFLRRLQCYQSAEGYIKQTASCFSDDEFTALCQRELFGIIGRTVSALPEMQKRVFREIRLEGKSYKEVGEQFGISMRSVEHQLRKATQTVTRQMRRACV